MIAKVIVDVPSRQTDRPFDYKVPAAFEDWIEVGSRVGVPFGGRVLQGFVTQLAETTDIDVEAAQAHFGAAGSRSAAAARSYRAGEMDEREILLLVDDGTAGDDTGSLEGEGRAACRHSG